MLEEKYQQKWSTCYLSLFTAKKKQWKVDQLLRNLLKSSKKFNWELQAQPY